MGVIFLVPAGSMLIAAMFIEFTRGVMTQSYSRGRQLMVAIIAVILTSVVGCVCDGIYLIGATLKIRRSITSCNRLWRYVMGSTSGQTKQEALKPVYDTKYEYMVHNFTDKRVPTSTGFNRSGAMVVVYAGNTLVQTFAVPAGAGTVWHVFTLRDGVITPGGTIDNTKPNN